MTINVQLTAINVKKPREAQTSVVHHNALDVFLNILALRWGLGASRRFWTLIIINDPLIIINTRKARNIDVH